MSQWITDRLPTKGDTAAPHYCVYNERGAVLYYDLIMDGEPWKPVPKCKPYVIKPKRYTVHNVYGGKPTDLMRYLEWFVWDELAKDSVAQNLLTREAAERVAAVYNEVLQ